MSKQLSRIAPWQAGKLFAVLYFFLSLIFVIPMILIAAIAPMPVGPGFHFSAGTLLLFPFMYALVALIFVPLACWFYNTAAKVVGGLEVTVTEVAEV
jgi:small-conductance mechanosensitive channel